MLVQGVRLKGLRVPLHEQFLEHCEVLPQCHPLKCATHYFLIKSVSKKQVHKVNEL